MSLFSYCQSTLKLWDTGSSQMTKSASHNAKKTFWTLMMLYCEDWVFIQCMRKAEYDLRLQVCKPEIHAEKGVKLQQHEEEALRFFSGWTLPHSETFIHATHTKKFFDVSINVAFVPAFRESEVNSYFNAFEKIATALDWPKGMWPILLHCKLVGKHKRWYRLFP